MGQQNLRLPSGLCIAFGDATEAVQLLDDFDAHDRPQVTIWPQDGRVSGLRSVNSLERPTFCPTDWLRAAGLAIWSQSSSASNTGHLRVAFCRSRLIFVAGASN